MLSETTSPLLIHVRLENCADALQATDGQNPYTWVCVSIGAVEIFITKSLLDLHLAIDSLKVLGYNCSMCR